MSGDEHLKFGAKDFDSLAQHVQGMIDDLQDGIGMANSKDGSFGDDALADKVDLFEKHWHQQAKPELIDHLGKLKQHIETSRDEFVAHERKLAAAANAKHAAPATEPHQRVPHTPPPPPPKPLPYDDGKGHNLAFPGQRPGWHPPMVPNILSLGAS